MTQTITPVEHKDWLEYIKLIDELKEEFQQIGKVPKSNNKEIWSEFREVLKRINLKKNKFYKKRKIEIKKLVDEKKKMIISVREIINNEDHLSNLK